MSTIQSVEQGETFARVTTTLYTASLVRFHDGWDAWISSELPGLPMRWGCVWEMHIDWPCHFDQATRDQVATLLCDEIRRRFPE